MTCQLLLNVQQSLFRPVVFQGPITLRSYPTHLQIPYYTAKKTGNPICKTWLLTGFLHLHHAQVPLLGIDCSLCLWFLMYFDLGFNFRGFFGLYFTAFILGTPGILYPIKLWTPVSQILAPAPLQQKVVLYTPPLCHRIIPPSCMGAKWRDFAIYGFLFIMYYSIEG